MNEPKTGWAGVSHKDEGIVKIIHDHNEYGMIYIFRYDYVSCPYAFSLGLHDHTEMIQ